MEWNDASITPENSNRDIIMYLKSGIIILGVYNNNEWLIQNFRNGHIYYVKDENYSKMLKKWSYIIY